MHGLVQTLRDLGFVDQEPDTGLYSLGPGLMELGQSPVDLNELRSRALNWTDALAAHSGEAAQVGVFSGGRVLIAHHVFRPAPGPERYDESGVQRLETGVTHPLHATALGKVLVAYDPRAARWIGQQPLESFTYRTMTDRSRLLRDLADVRDLGWAAAVEEEQPGEAEHRGARPGRDGTRDRGAWHPRPCRGRLRRPGAAARVAGHEGDGGSPADLARVRPRARRVKPQYVAALDQGTTSTRCVLYDRQGRMVSLAQRLQHQYYPRPGWVEHDAEEIWQLVQELLPQALRDAGVSADQVVALGVTNQRETTVVWDRATGRPVGPAIVWQDTRTSGCLGELTDGYDEAELAKRTGLPLVSYFSGPKLRWLLDSDPLLRARAERGELAFGTMDSWLVWNLTGGLHVTDVTNASRTMLMNLETLDWDDDLLEAMRVPRAVLPEIRPSMGALAVTREPVAGIPVTAVLGDQQASLFGQTAFERGEAKCTFGTGSFLLMNTGTDLVRSRSGLITTVAHKVDGEPPVYALEGSIAFAGALVEWCRTSLDLIKSPAEIETLARSVDSNGGCFVVPAFSGLYAPYWESRAQGMVVGLTSYVTKGHIARAVLEATAWQTKDVVDAMNADAGVPLSFLAVDGGMTGNNLLMQTVADVLDVPVVRPMMAESVALGAGYAAGLAAGYWPDRSVLRAHWHRASQWRAEMPAETRLAQHEAWQRAVELSIAWGQGRGGQES